MNELTKTLVAAAVTGVAVGVSTYYGMGAVDKLKAKRAEKKAAKKEN